jgi:flavin reductase
LDAASLREATSRWVTGVGVVTTTVADGAPQGALVNNVACASWEPPLYVACLGNTSHTLAGVLSSRAFNIHFLARGQEQLAMAFAAKEGDKFAGVAHALGLRGAPVLRDALVCLECELDSTVPAGASTLVIGRVVAARSRHGQPLAMCGRDFVMVGAARA